MAENDDDELMKKSVSLERITSQAHIQKNFSTEVNAPQKAIAIQL